MLIVSATFATNAKAQGPGPAAEPSAEAVTAARRDEASTDHAVDDSALTQPAEENATDGVAPDLSEGVANASACAPCEPVVQQLLRPTDAQVLEMAQEIRARERAELIAERAPARARRRRTRRIVLPILGVVVAGVIAGAVVAINRQPPPPPRWEPGDWCILYCD